MKTKTHVNKVYITVITELFRFYLDKKYDSKIKYKKIVKKRRKKIFYGE